MLTDKEIRGAAAQDKAYRIRDDKGLWLQINPNGSKLWRYRYEFAGREKMLALGRYPAMSLAAARKGREAARALLDEGKDPATEKALTRAGNVASSLSTFEAVARDWLKVRGVSWVPRHTRAIELSLELHVFPTLGKLPIAGITSPMVLALLRRVEAQGTPDLAKRLRQRLSMVFVHAIATGQGESDPAAVVVPALVPRSIGKQPAITDLAQARAMLRKVEETSSEPWVRTLNRFQALTAVRPGEARGAAWAEIEGLDTDKPLWRIPPERMKKRREHLVPLAPQAAELLRLMHQLTGSSPFVFPHRHSSKRPGGTTALAVLLNRAGFAGKHVPHGWRATFSTVMNERFPEDHAAIEIMLAHVSRNAVAAAYNRALRLERRRELATTWAGLLLEGALPAAALFDPVSQPAA
ncbi:tyrosine-type recombinase/integrase [Roseomonas elaeocarpi]|uniref:Tyrosine-type recombinase/integrase n=1 Tax=Roseomonas elaeocarpi TaxID=907779 RepID=A0ABV6JWB5_9PROT